MLLFHSYIMRDSDCAALRGRNNEPVWRRTALHFVSKSEFQRVRDSATVLNILNNEWREDAKSPWWKRHVRSVQACNFLNLSDRGRIKLDIKCGNRPLCHIDLIFIFFSLRFKKLSAGSGFISPLPVVSQNPPLPAASLAYRLPSS